jgi:hypothetical protein
MDEQRDPSARRLRSVVWLLILSSITIGVGGVMFSGRVFFDNLIPGLSGLLLGIGITVALIDPVVSAQREEHSRTLLSAARDAYGRRMAWVLGICHSWYVIPVDPGIREWSFGDPDHVYLGIQHVLEWFAADATPPAQRDASAVKVWIEGKDYLLFIRDWFCPLVLDKSDSQEACEAVGRLLYTIDDLESHAIAPSEDGTYLALREFLRQAQKVVEALTQAFG